MANVVRNNVRIPSSPGTLQAGNQNTPGGSFPITRKSTRALNVISHKIQLNNIGFGITASPGGAADGAGQKIMTLPAGKWLVLGVDPEFTVTTGATCSVATAVFALGTAVAGDANAALTATEADILASQTLGDGTLAANAAETEAATFIGTGAAVGLVGGATATDVYFNIAGTFTDASVTNQVIRINGTIELLLIDLGGNS